MFWCSHIQSKGKFGLVWRVAMNTRKPKDKQEVLKVKIFRLCEDIMHLLPKKGIGERSRYSLYLASNLVYGVVLMLNEQMYQLLRDLLAFNCCTVMPIDSTMGNKRQRSDQGESIELPAKRRAGNKSSLENGTYDNLDEMMDAFNIEELFDLSANTAPLDLITISEQDFAQQITIERELEDFGQLETRPPDDFVQASNPPTEESYFDDVLRRNDRASVAINVDYDENNVEMPGNNNLEEMCTTINEYSNLSPDTARQQKSSMHASINRFDTYDENIPTDSNLGQVNPDVNSESFRLSALRAPDISVIPKRSKKKKRVIIDDFTRFNEAEKIQRKNEVEHCRYDEDEFEQGLNSIMKNLTLFCDDDIISQRLPALNPYTIVTNTRIESFKNVQKANPNMRNSIFNYRELDKSNKFAFDEHFTELFNGHFFALVQSNVPSEEEIDNELLEQFLQNDQYAPTGENLLPMHDAEEVTDDTFHETTIATGGHVQDHHERIVGSETSPSSQFMTTGKDKTILLIKKPSLKRSKRVKIAGVQESENIDYDEAETLEEARRKPSSRTFDSLLVSGATDSLAVDVAAQTLNVDDLSVIQPPVNIDQTPVSYPADLTDEKALEHSHTLEQSQIPVASWLNDGTLAVAPVLSSRETIQNTYDEIISMMNRNGTSTITFAQLCIPGVCPKNNAAKRFNNLLQCLKEGTLSAKWRFGEEEITITRDRRCGISLASDSTNNSFPMSSIISDQLQQWNEDDIVDETQFAPHADINIASESSFE